jgi:hypothetical protein
MHSAVVAAVARSKIPRRSQVFLLAMGIWFLWRGFGG